MLENYPVIVVHANELGIYFCGTRSVHIWRSTEIPGDRGGGLMDSGGPAPRVDGQDIPSPLSTVHRLARGSVSKMDFMVEIGEWRSNRHRSRQEAVPRSCHSRRRYRRPAIGRLRRQVILSSILKLNKSGMEPRAGRWPGCERVAEAVHSRKRSIAAGRGGSRRLGAQRAREESERGHDRCARG